MSSSSKKTLLWLLGWTCFFMLLLFFYAPVLWKSTYSAPDVAGAAVATTTPLLAVKHVETPVAVKALYMTACVAGTPSWRESLKKLIETTELNAVVLDIKDSTGSISFNTSLSTGAGKGCTVRDLKEFIASLHASDIYVIGRISVFQDPNYTAVHPELAVQKLDGSVWKDYKGLSFVDVGAKPYWDYIVSLSNESYALGFDELNYDYIRYPSDGNLKDIKFSWTVGTSTKAQMLKSFFAYLSEKMSSSGAKRSADIFGMTTTVENDMNIGQILENALPYFDYIAPMVYPSHYPANWNGFAKPAEHPYEVIKIAMHRAVEREAAWRTLNGIATTTPSKLRPWLQDFDLGATYDATKVRAQIQATYDVGLTSWMMWSAANTYTESALLPE